MATIQAFVHAQISTYSWEEGKVSFYIFSSDMSKHGYTLVDTVEVEFDEPDHASIVNGTVKLLREKQKQTRADAELACTQIDEQINNLLCIENKPTEVK